MLKRLFVTDNDVSALVLRIFLAAVFFPHGAQKVLGWFGGQGLQATLHTFAVHMHIPPALAILAIAAEFLGPIGLVLGLLTRVAAFGIAFSMGVAIFLVHFKFGFFMNWFGKQAGEGFEYHLLVIAIGLALMIKGGGLWSIDRALSKGDK